MQTLPHHDALGEHDASDAVLLARSVEQPACFDALMERHFDAIFRFVAMRVGPQMAEDIVAEAFTAAFQVRDRFDRTAPSARPWLYGIAVNRLHKHRYAERRWLRGCIGEVAPSGTDDTDEVHTRLDARQLAPELARAMELLSPGERDVLLLHALGDLTHEEIAEALGIRRGTAKTRLSRATARLRPHMHRHHTDAGDAHA